jgi:hypothetical protein
MSIAGCHQTCTILVLAIYTAGSTLSRNELLVEWRVLRFSSIMGRRSILACGALGLFAAAACDSKPVDVTGSLLLGGKRTDLTTVPLKLIAQRCREPERKDLTLRLMTPGRYHTDDEVVWFSATPGVTRVGVKGEPEHVRAWSDGGVVGPEKGWVRYTTLATMGPIEVEFDLDFGEYGRLKGRARVAKTDEIPCPTPEPPPLPPVP